MEEARHPTILGGGELTPVEGPRSSNSMVYLKGYVLLNMIVHIIL
jgi:hypothetical protein